MTMLGLLALLFSYYGTDTVIVSSSGYNSINYRRTYGSYYIERLLSKELTVKIRGWESSYWDSLSQNLYRSTNNLASVEYRPTEWLAIASGLDGTRSKTVNTGGGQGYLAHSTRGFIETETSTDLLYSYYRLQYGNERFAYLGYGTDYGIDNVMSDKARIKVNAPPCTLKFSHERYVETNELDRGDTIEITSARVPFLKGWGQSGGQLHRRRYVAYSDYQNLGAELWIRDTFLITPRIGFNLTGTYSIDTVTYYGDGSLTRKETERELDARLSYHPLQRTYVTLEFSNHNTIRDQVEESFDEDKVKYAFTGSIRHNFNRRPPQARYSPAGFIASPGYFSFSQSLSLEKIATPESNLQDRDIASENTTLSLYWYPSQFIESSFYFKHLIEREHYLKVEKAASSKENRSSRAYMTFEVAVPKYLSLYSWTDVRFSFTRYYIDSTSNKASRTFYEYVSLTLFQQAVLQPAANLNWTRYENWEMISGDLTLTNQQDVVSQSYSLSFVQFRRQEAPKWSWEKWEEKEWLRIKPFVGFEITVVPLEMLGLVVKNHFIGMDITYHPWPYVSLIGGIKFTRSDYDQAPFEASLSVNSSF